MFPHRSKTLFDRAVTQVGVVPLDELLPALLAEIAALLSVERTGYYRMDDGGGAIRLEIQFLLSTQSCDTPPVKLRAADYPGYFAALRDPANLIVSHDVMADARLVEFQEYYFKPLGITSMLDVPIHRSGKLFGVVCLEHVGPRRQWAEEDVEIARSLGHLIALALETRDRQQMQEELRLSLEREKELVEMKTNFINLVSHEFRTPLGVIWSAADILENYSDRLRPEQRADQLQDIRHATRQMSELMEEVLLVGKVESGNMSCRTSPLDLADFCHRLADEQSSATHHRCPILLEMTGVDEMAAGDEGLLRHIFSNLLSNAVKYSPPAAEVKFSARRNGTEVEFVVSDRGIGIDPADQKHLFVTFFRGRNVGMHPGTGLGLVIVQRCVTLHGGTMEFESMPGEGTRFTIRLDLFPLTKPTP